MLKTKVKLTDELSKLIKNTRISNKIKSTELAEHLGKSVAYVSKLENKRFKYIDFNLLNDILKFLTKDTNENFDDFITKTLEKCHIEKIEEDDEDWLFKFDEEVRQIPIPKELAAYIDEKVKELNLTSEQLVNIINENRDLEDIDSSKYDKNVLIKTQDKDDSFFIIFNLDKNLITDILSEKKKTINYITMNGILYNIFRLQKHTIKDSSTEAQKTLASFKFYTLGQRNKLIRQKHQQENLDTILSEYDSKNIEYVNNILDSIKMLSAWNIEYSNSYLEELSESFNIDDTSFILAIIGRPFYKLKNLDKGNKNNFLKELSNLINKFSKIEYDESNDFNEY